MTFFFALHLNLGRKLDISGRDDLFFALHLNLGRKFDISGRDDLSFFCSSPIFSRKKANCRLARGKIWPIILADFDAQIEKGGPSLL